MTVDALLEILVSVVIPCVLALAEGILAARSLSDERWAERSLWIALFVGLLVLAIVLAFVQQVRLSTRERAAGLMQQAKDIESEGNIKYTQGQLDSINKILAQVVSADTSGSQTLTKALLQGAFTASSKGGGVEPPAIQRMTNAQLRAKVSEFVNAMRKECSDYMTRTETQGSEDFENLEKLPPAERDKAFQKSTNRTVTNMNNNLRLQQVYVGDATEYKEELLRRLGPQDPSMVPVPTFGGGRRACHDRLSASSWHCRLPGTPN